EFIELGTAYPFEPKVEESGVSAFARAAEKTGENKIAEMLSRVMESFQGQRTGDREHDKGVLKGAFEEILGELEGEVSQGMADLRNHMIQVRRRPFQETVKLVSIPKGEWADRPAAREIMGVLENAGFKEFGSWHLESNPALQSL